MMFEVKVEIEEIEDSGWDVESVRRKSTSGSRQALILVPQSICLELGHIPFNSQISLLSSLKPATAGGIVLDRPMQQSHFKLSKR